MRTRESVNLVSNGRNSSRTCRQLTQQNVQKSRTTTRPRRSDRHNESPPVFSHPRPTSSGALTRTRLTLVPLVLSAHLLSAHLLASAAVVDPAAPGSSRGSP